MKKILIKILWKIGLLWRTLYSPNTSKYLDFIKSILYTAWISPELKYFGSGSRITSFMALHGAKYISIGKNCSIGKLAVITAWDSYGSDQYTPQIVIGDNVIIGTEIHITAINLIHIGNNVLTGKKVTITDNSHGKSNISSFDKSPSERPLSSAGPVVIEDNVWIGDKVTILSGVRIGRNAIIGANSVVTKDVEPNCVVGGIPAKVIKIVNEDYGK